MNKTKLSTEVINRLPAGSYYDTQDGLMLRVSATCKSWRFYKWSSAEGRPIKRALGKFPRIGIDAARKAARAKLHELDTGKVSADRTSLDALVDRYELHLKASGVRYPQRVRRLFDLSWSALAGRKLTAITPAEIKDKHDAIAGMRGPHAAAGAVKLLRCLFNYANELELCDKNPAKRVRIKADNKRDVFLTVAELKLLRSALAEQPQDIQDYFGLVLLTGARRGNVAAMRWEDVKGDIWIIPAEASKTKRSYEVPLHPLALEILSRRISSSATNFVFPGEYSSSGHVGDPWPWLKLVRNACVQRGLTKHFTLHDLRRTFATLLTANGVPLTVVSKALGHVNVQTTPIYARADTETVRKAVMMLS